LIFLIKKLQEQIYSLPEFGMSNFMAQGCNLLVPSVVNYNNIVQ